MKVVTTLLLCTILHPAGAEGPGIVVGYYAIESQMVLPHMEEMRRRSINVQVCVDRDNAAQLFPIFQQRALSGCTLLPQNDLTNGRYIMHCSGVNGASGTAELSIKHDRIKGELIAKIGGKNMTFSQYINARRIGECDR